MNPIPNPTQNQDTLTHEELTYLKALYLLNNKYNFKNKCFNKDGTISFKRHSLTQDENQFVFCKCCKLLRIRNYEQLKHLLHNNQTNLTLIHININTLYSKFIHKEPKRIPKYKLKEFNILLCNIYTSPIKRFKDLISFIHKHGTKITIINDNLLPLETVKKDFLSLAQLYYMYYKKSYSDVEHQFKMKLPFNKNLYNLRTHQFIVPNLNLNLYHALIRPNVQNIFNSDCRGIAYLKINAHQYICNLMNRANCEYSLFNNPQKYNNMVLFFKDYRGNKCRLIIRDDLIYIECSY